MAAERNRLSGYLATICVFAFWRYGSNALPQQMGPDPSLLPSFDSPQQQQQQQQLQPQNQPQQQPRPLLQGMEQKSISAGENVNNMTPLDLNICSDTNYRSVDTLPGLRRSTEMRTLQLGQSGVIWPMGNRSIPFNADCNLQLSACAACLILISWNAPSTDIRSSDQQQVDREGASYRYTCESVWDFRDRLRCVDLRLIETDADQTTLKPYQRVSLVNPPSEYRNQQFISSSYKLDLNLQFWRGDLERANALRQLFPLKYVVIDNTRVVRGRPSPADLPTNYSDGFIASPRFPKTYPEGVSVNYTLINEDPEGSVRLIFTDFRLHYMSILKIIDSNGQEIANTQSQYGTSQRPSALQSSGHTLTIMFTANNYKHDIGFRANYRFVKEKSWLEQPSPKSCDKFFEDTGGVITIENLNLDAYTYVDCIWILEKPRYAPIGFDKLYLKVEDFSVNSGGKGVQLDVHVGRTSINRRLLTIFGPKSSEQLAREQPQEGFISDSILQQAAEKAAPTTLEEDDSDTGFYLRLRGFLGSSTGMAVSFAQFYRWATAICHDVNEFHCDNGRCISNRYQCDTHDHCGDFSDEGKCQNRKSEHGSKGRMGTFTGPDGEPEGSSLPLGGYTTTILLVAGLVGLTLVLIMITIIVARVYRQKLIRRFAATAVVNAGDGGGDLNGDAMSGLSTSNSIGNVLNRSSSTGIMMSMDDQLGSRPAPSLHQVGNRRLLVLPESEIGVLEAPPTYDDALKHPTVPPSAATTLLRSSQQLNMSGPIPSPVHGSGFNFSGQAPTSSGGLTANTPSAAGPSTDLVSTSFDNPAFDLGPDPPTVPDGQLRRSHHRSRRRSRSGDSTSTTTSSTESDISGSCTGSDLDTASDGEIGNENGASISATAENINDESVQFRNHDDIIRPSTENPVSSRPPEENFDSALQQTQGIRKPPVPLPRSSIMTRIPVPPTPTETEQSTAGVSDQNRLNSTLV